MNYIIFKYSDKKEYTRCFKCLILCKNLIYRITKKEYTPTSYTCCIDILRDKLDIFIKYNNGIIRKYNTFNICAYLLEFNYNIYKLIL